MYRWSEFNLLSSIVEHIIRDACSHYQNHIRELCYDDLPNHGELYSLVFKDVLLPHHKYQHQEHVELTKIYKEHDAGV